MLKRLLTFAAIAAGTLILTPTPASATAPVPGAFCAAADEGATRQAANHRWYLCAQDTRGVRRWTPTTTPSNPTPQPTCTTGGYTRHCPIPSTGAPGYGNHPSPSSTPSPSIPMHSLPVTSSLDGRVLAGLIVTGVLLILFGTAALAWKPISRRRRPRGLRRHAAQA